MMAPRKTTDGSTKKVMNKGAWTAEEDRKLSEYVEIHGPKRWKTIANKSGLNRCGKSCRLRWLNYLRPNIKRGNISDDEEDMIVRLHKLLGNRWSLIAGRLPGRTDNEIKNYWNSHLSKKMNHKGHETTTRDQLSPAAIESPSPSSEQPPESDTVPARLVKEGDSSMMDNNKAAAFANNLDNNVNFDVNELFDFTVEGSYGMEWVNKFLELDEDSWLSDNKKFGDDRGDDNHNK